MLSRFLNPKNDLTFKRLFGSEANKDILVHFLNDIFARTTNPIEKVEIIKPNIDPEIKELRVSIIDVLCKDLEGNTFIVEMQCDVDTAFIKRAQYYASKVYISQRGKGDTYKDLKSITFLAILDGKLFPDKKEYLSHHVILDKNSYEHDLKDFSFSFLELGKFKKKYNELTTILEKWTYFLKNASETSNEELPLIVGSDIIIEKAFEVLDEYNYSKEEMLYYDQLERNEDVYKTLLSDSEAKGEAKGLQQGKTEGKIEVAKAMKGMGVANDIIQKATGLNADEITKI
ncbi:transposase [Gammaproteobacteria bacterium]